MALLNTYMCSNKDCVEKGIEKELWIELSTDVPRCETCKECMTKVWKVGGVKTSDGFKK